MPALKPSKSGSVAPRISAKARELLKANRALKAEIARVKSDAESEIRKRHRVEDELSRFGGARVQVDNFSGVRRFVVEINEYEARSAKHGWMVYELAIKRLVQSLHDHAMAQKSGVAEAFAKSETDKMRKALRGKAVVQALGITHENMRVVYELTGIMRESSRDGRWYSPEGKAAMMQLAELLNVGVDVIMKEYHEKDIETVFP